MKRCLTAIFFLVFFVFGRSSEATVYQVKINVNSPAAAVNYPVKVYIDAGTLQQATGSTYPDMRGLRFTNVSGTQLPFWIHITKHAQRTIGNLPVWVQVDSLAPGNNTIYMTYDPGISNASTTPLPNGNTYCGAQVTAVSGGAALPATPFSGGQCGENVFGTGMFAFDYNEYLSYTYPNGGCGQWVSATASDGKWVSGNVSGHSTYIYGFNTVQTANTFLLHYRYHLNSTPSWNVYLLTQYSPAPTSSTVLNADSTHGYRVQVNYLSTSGSGLYYNYSIQVQVRTGSSWTNVGSSMAWTPYSNTVNEFDIKVTATTISITVNGALIGSVSRSDSFSSPGYVGFYSTDTNGAECDSFATNTISPIWVINNDLSSEPTATVVGNADIQMDETVPNTVDASSPYLGQNVIEVVPKMQVLADYVSGNTLDKYIYSGYPLASIQQGSTQWFKYQLFVNNRGSSSDTFNINLSTAPAQYSGSWYIGYSYPAGSTAIVGNLPGTGATPTSGQVTLASGATQEIDVYVMPSTNALFQGNQGKLAMNFNVTSTGDFSQDNVQFVANVQGKSGCYWQYQLPINISYTDSAKTCNLLNYQVLVTLTNFDFSGARSDGSDLMFTDASGTMIPFWIKSFKRGSSGSGSFWVQVPAITSSCTPSPPTGSCPSSCAATAANTTIYLWWGNSNYTVSQSNENNTFDLWEDWSTGGSSTRTAGTRPGCPDGSNDTDSSLNCSGQVSDPTRWLNNPSPSNPFNWWTTVYNTGLPPIPTSTSNTSSNSIQTICKPNGQGTNDAGPILSNGSVKWTNYEVMYASRQDSCGTQATYNPVLFADSGNMWGFESFNNEFIFRPFTYGTDWTWNYQNGVSSVSGFDSTYPISGKTYINKLRVFHNPSSGQTHLKVMSTTANSTPSDTDSDTGFYTLGDIYPSAQVTAASGGIGFGGWDGGQNYGNIRVRKFCEPDPAYNTSPGNTVSTPPKPIETLSTPAITPPLMNGRAVLLTAYLTPWTWTGDLTAIYADCYINGDCKSGENQTQLGTISLWGDTSASTATGFGAQLEAAVAGDDNRSNINDASWQYDGRYIFTDIAGQSGNYAFGKTNFSTLAPLLGVSTAAATSLIRYVRGQYQTAYARSAVRNLCTSGTADTCQWKLDDIIHSSPLVVGIPNMMYSDPNYSAFQNSNNGRDLVTYIGTNGGMIHAVRMASFNTTTNQYQKDATATELWAFIPNGILGSLSSIANGNHQYSADGLLRAIDITSGSTYKTVLVGGLRSGGQSLFALDITNPESPSVLFDINAGTNPGAFANIGRSWSAPALGRLCESQTSGVCTGGRWVAIIGSGPDPYDLNNLTKTAYLSIIDLSSSPGSVIKQIQVSSKPGNITTNIAALRDQNGYIQKIYFGDYYGALWRVDLSTSAKVTTVVGLSGLRTQDMLFQPSDYATSNITAHYPPSRPITAQPALGYAGTNQYWVYFGTGDYDLYNSSYPSQAFYGLNDTGSLSPYSDAQLTDMTLSTAVNGNNNSWFITLGQTSSVDVTLSVDNTCVNSCTDTGKSVTYCSSICTTITSSTKDSNERVLNPAAVYGGYVFFSTYDPLNNPCGGGVSRFYGVQFTSGSTPAGLMLSSNNATPIRSTVISSSGGVPSTPMIFSGSGGQGQVVAAGLENVSTGGLTKVMLDPSKFGQNINILYWRRKR